jgi:Fic family protein
MDEAVIDLAEFIAESDAIEGIYDDPELLMRQILARKKDGHVGALLMLEVLVQSPLNNGGYVTKELICKLQGLITAEQQKKFGGFKLSPKLVGKYRPCNILVADKTDFPSFEEVPSIMGELIKRIEFWQSNARFYPWDNNVKSIARFHFQFEGIHPFGDGNGRTGRALVYYLMRWAGLRPFIFTNRDKHESYYPCFADRENSLPMEKYFVTKAVEYKP